MITIRTAARLRTTTTRTLCAALLSGGALMGLCRGASAQFAFEEEVVPPRVVAWRLADQGFTGLSRPRFNGRVYVVEAVSPAGMPMRLFVDPGSGGIVGRQRLGGPDTYARLERPAPGFGWTEEDAGPRRIVRPVPTEEAPALRLDRRPASTSARPETNPDAVNPDHVGRSTPPRKVARTAPVRNPDLRASHRTSPEAPAPKIVPAETATTESKTGPAPETKSAAIDKSAAIEKAPSASPAQRPDEAAKPSVPAVADAAKSTAKEWKDPPADRKPVRVIGGATIVPGPSEKEPAAQ
ncbi:hypothetical protein MKK75_16375 [Methylobacterium sp. J-030]|uniref:hypothetical protein n=1 Tax=Methylobacterium sp. J-030 TaxID=2836627 RepID=UPI001FB90A83|nr:hypothetical protein [Methylobacterium sp. J-030]MCJ2070357.1 hypothetical protein [Methylobacterium sp. J-030]